MVNKLFKEERQIVREGADPHMISKFERHYNKVGNFGHIFHDFITLQKRVRATG